MTDYTIRPVKENDLEELLHMISEHADFEQASPGPEPDKEKLRVALFEPPARLHCWVVEIAEQGQQIFNGQQLAGYVSFTFDYSTWDTAEFLHMDCLYLRASSRGRGIGTAIINKLYQVARERHCVNLQWQTPPFNERAIHFYHGIQAVSKDKVRFILAVSPSV